MEVVLEKYFVTDFLQKEDFEENFIYELLNGTIVKRSAPSLLHQSILRKLVHIFEDYLAEKKLGEFFFAPIDVVLDEENLVIPDLVFVFESKKDILKENYIAGIPDLVVEILSPSTARYDRGEKMKLYKKHQVPEYWIIEPKMQVVEIYTYQNGDYDLQEYAMEKGWVKSKILQDLQFDISEIFKT
ncbi:MAG: Uma2 family endonuclease [Raineya sp.]|nr:Uma2 family endonuclease [Raineya sp.]